jgi:hypothetical protein
MNEEMSSFEANGVFEYTELPESRKPVGGRWVYSIKRNEQGAVSKFKARWVAKGYSQREGIDFTETYAPVSKMATLQTLLTIAADEDLELRQIDFKTAFLTANLVETVYMDQPTGYEQPDSEERNSSLTSSRSSTDYDNHPSRSTTDQATSSIRSSSEPSRPIAAFTSDARTADADSFSSTSTMSLQRARREMSTR